MSAAIDANVLLYASDPSSEAHQANRDRLGGLAHGPELLYLFWPVALAYLRISTHSSVFTMPLAVDQALDNLQALITRPHVRTPGEDEGFWAALRSAVSDGSARGNLVTDAHIVTLMRRNGVTQIWTRDRDFLRFEGIRILDPLADHGDRP